VDHRSGFSCHSPTRSGPAPCFGGDESENLKQVNQSKEAEQETQKEPKDATKSTEEQRQLQEQLDHRDDDPDAPGLHQSRRNLPDESTR
jgi:hypothetical protein